MSTTVSYKCPHCPAVYPNPKHRDVIMPLEPPRCSNHIGGKSYQMVAVKQAA